MEAATGPPLLFASSSSGSSGEDPNPVATESSEKERETSTRGVLFLTTSVSVLPFTILHTGVLISLWNGLICVCKSVHIVALVMYGR